ncbi:MAG: hypothetical protein ABSF99_01090 [Anaerolineales bacterium]|jgi:hypothetical protein
MLHLQRMIGNQAVQRLLTNAKEVEVGLASTASPRFAHDFSQIPVHPKLEAEDLTPAHHESRALMDMSASGNGKDTVGLIEGKGPDGGEGPKDAGAPAATKKTAGVDSFVVKWTKNPASGPTIAKLRLDSSAKFKNDAAHDPALAEFRQNASFKFEITAGPNKGQKSSQPLQDDNYSRADDSAGNTINDVNFVTNDNPGTARETPIDKDDVIDFSFTAEQMIIDTSDRNKVIKKHGPHTATIKGKHERAFDGVPKTFS